MIDIQKLAEAMILFTKLPCINIYFEEGPIQTCEEDEGYIPHLYKFEGKYVIDWIGSEDDSLHRINGKTPEDAIHNAFNWCVENKLISIN